MAKRIKFTPEDIEATVLEFRESLKTIPDGKISFTKTLGTISRKATVFFSELAWLKMQGLIWNFDKEVAWHGVATRGTDENEDDYYINDIIVYPQEVTGATVTTDQVKYQSWLYALNDDTFNNLRFQGHSHVNMGTTPSGVDTNLYNEILSQLNADMFYIFMIWNKRGEKTIKIYDLKKNLYFDTSDVTVKVIQGEIGVEAFISEAKRQVQDKPVTPAPTYTSYYNYGSWNRNTYSAPSYSAKTVNPEAKNTEKKSDTKTKQSGFGKALRKGRRKKEEKKEAVVPVTSFDDDDDWDYGYKGWMY